MRVRIIDCSHRDRPHLDITANDVISERHGVTILDAKATNPDLITGVISIDDLTNLLTNRQDAISLSHDWTVRVSA